MSISATDAVRAGLLRFPPPDQCFAGRHGGTKDYVINTRGAGASLELRELIVSALAESASDSPPFDVIGGIAKAGTAWGAWLAWMIGKPFANVLLDGPRPSGLQREVEGDVADKKVLLVDNWTRSGASLRAATSVIERAGGIVAGALTIVRHPATEPAVPLCSPWTIQELLAAAHNLGLWTAPGTHPDLQP